MSTTHPTDLTTEWDDIQRKYGNLPKLVKGKTIEELDSEFVQLTEAIVLRDVRLREWKKKLATKDITYGTLVGIKSEDFVEQVTNASKCHLNSDLSSSQSLNDDARDHFVNTDTICGENELLSKTGNYVPVLLVDDKRESILLRDAWSILAKKYPNIKFTIGHVSNVLKCEGNKNITPPASILLYFAGSCILQKHAYTAFKAENFEFASKSVEDKLAYSLELILNSVKGHTPLFSQKMDSDSDDEDTDEENSFKSSGKDLKCNFLNKLTRGNIDNSNSKAYTSWILDKAIGDD